MFDFGFHFFGNSRSSTPPTPPPSDDFIIKVKTDNAGSGANQFTLPTTGSGYDYTIDWGDGTVEEITSDASQTHTYATAGEYVITISGTFPRIFFNNGGDRLKLIETINFGDVGWSSFNSAFYGCANMTINENATGNLGSGASHFMMAFRDCSSIVVFPELDMSGADGGLAYVRCFNGCTSMNTFLTKKFGNGSFERCWQGCNSLKDFPELDLSGGTNFILTWNSMGTLNSFATRNFFNMTNGINAFSNTTLPTSDYSDILITQRANNNNNNLTFHGGNSKYNTAGGIARAELTDTVANGGQNWSITDSGAE